MKKKLLTMYVKMMNPVKNERGAQSLEWLGLAALLILILGIISTALSSQSESIGNIIKNIVTKNFKYGWKLIYKKIFIYVSKN